MPELYNFRIFISHAWSYGEEYERMVNLLENELFFKYTNYSAPKDKPLELSGSASKEKIKTAITNKIQQVQCVVVISGIYTSHKEWMQYEINEAVRMKKYIVGVVPWGNQNIPEIVRSNSDEVVKWNASSIVSAIRNSI